MGTSKTSVGPGKNVPLIPSFLTPTGPAPTAPQPVDNDGSSANDSPNQTPDEEGAANPQQDRPLIALPLSITNRFVGARRAVNSFAKSGSTEALKSGLGNYVKNGYGGGVTASQRMEKGARTAANVLQALGGGTDTGAAAATFASFDLASLAGLSHEDVADRIVEAVCPENVSLDDAAAREAVCNALGEILTENPDADVTQLPESIIVDCYLRTLAYTTAAIVLADIGASIQKGSGGNAVTANQRYTEVRQFILERYREQKSALDAQGRQMDKRGAEAFGRTITREVISVFESYLA